MIAVPISDYILVDKKICKELIIILRDAAPQYFARPNLIDLRSTLEEVVEMPHLDHRVDE